MSIYINRFIKFEGAKTVDGILPITDSSLTFHTNPKGPVDQVRCFYKNGVVEVSTFYYDCIKRKYLDIPEVTIYEKKEYKSGDKVLISRSGYIKEAIIDCTRFEKDSSYITSGYYLYESLDNYDSNMSRKDITEEFYMVTIKKCVYILQEYGEVDKKYFYKPNQL